MQNKLKTLGIVMAVLITVSIPAYVYAKPVIGNKLLTATVGAKKTIAWSSKVIFKKAVKMKKDLVVLGLATLGDTHVTGNLTLDNGLPVSTLTNTTSTNGDVVEGVTKYRTISGDALTALLNGESNALTTFDAGTTVLDVIVSSDVASESVANITIGTDANWREFTNDSDAFIATYDAQSLYTERLTVLPESYPSILMNGNTTTTDNAAITIQSNVDISDTSFNGKVVILYF